MDQMMQQMPPPEEEGLPPEIAQAMETLMAGQGAPAGPEGAPAAPPSEPDGDLLRQAIKLLEQAVSAEPDDVDSQKLAAALKTLYDVAAARQKEDQGLMGGGNMRALSRAYGA
jgi:hypothetical protein